MRTTPRKALRAGLAAVATLGSLVIIAGPATANHPVFVEGNCFGPGMGMAATGLQTSPVPPGNCGDYDGDTHIGAAEDNDGDNNFGTINAALASVAQNGRVTIVASGAFPEVVTLNPTAGGNITLVAAPGVEANIDAVVQGNAGSAQRQGAPGIIVDGCARCRVSIRNVVSRNWTEGILVRGDSHVSIDQVKLEGNLNYGIQVLDRARVSVTVSDINSTGYRKSAAGVGTANPGIGIEFEDSSQGNIYESTVTGSAAGGIVGAFGSYALSDTQFFDNNPNYIFTR